MMFTSSASRKEPELGSTKYNLRSVPTKGTRKRNPDEYFVLNGRRSPIVSKPWKYQSNSQLTLGRSANSSFLNGSVSKDVIPTYNDAIECNEDGQFDDFTEEPERELHRLKEDTIYIDNPSETAWYLDPVHRPQSRTLDFHELTRKSPLQASVLKSNMEGDIYPTPEEDISKIPIESFNVSLFKNAEDKMLSCRTLTALTSPYQYKLAKLKMERLKLEEERLLHVKTLSELERIRGPTPRWYEMTTPGFHVEAKKNNQMLASKGNYKEIMTYRHELLDALERSNIKETVEN